MRPSYRAASYEYPPSTLEVTEQEILGSYQGDHWRCRTLSAMPTPGSPLKFRDRGIAHSLASKCNPSLGEKAIAAIGSCRIPDTVPALKELARIHQANIERSLERRIQVAKLRGDLALVQLLESERSQLV